MTQASTRGSGNDGDKGAYDGQVVDAACAPPASGWQNISPPGSNYTTTDTGMNAIGVRPDNPAIVYVGADSNGIFRTTDCGATWAKVNTGENAAALSSGREWSLVIDPVTPDVMYTTEGYGMDGLWKSTNAGVDWTNVFTSSVAETFLSGNGQIAGIALDPADHTHLVLSGHQGTGCTYDGGAVGTCVAESTDSGATWKLITIPQPWGEGSTVAIVNRTTWLWAAIFGGLWQTSDEGAAWTEVSVDDGGLQKGLPNAYAVANNYEPYVWQDTSGRYYVPSQSWWLPGGLLQSSPHDTSHWEAIAKSPQSVSLYPTSTQIVMCNGVGKPDFYSAPQSDPTSWTELPTPPLAAPVSGTIGGGCQNLAYDPVHHLLYASMLSTGLWQLYVP